MYIRQVKTLLLFFAFADSRGRLSLQTLFFIFFLIVNLFSSHRLTFMEPRHYGGIFVAQKTAAPKGAAENIIVYTLLYTAENYLVEKP